MLLNSKGNFTFTLSSIFQFLFVVVVSQSLVTCCASQTARFIMKNFYNNTETEVKTTILPNSKKNSSGQNQLKEKGRGRTVVGAPYQIKGKWYYPQHDPTYKRVGEASWYGEDFHGHLTANGEIYDMYRLTAAHPTMTLPSYARVTNLSNGSSIVVRVNDRGPFMKDRIIDLSKQAAEILGYASKGVENVKVEYISPAPVGHYDGAYLMSSYTSGNAVSASLELADITKENIVLERLSGEQKQPNKTFLVNLPKNNPVLNHKLMFSKKMAFMNKPNKKIIFN